MCCFPLLNFAWHATNLTTHYSENVGNRYFLTMRAVETDEFANPAQGPLIGLVQKLLYAIVISVYTDPQGQIVARMNLFAYLTLATGVASLVAALVGVVRARSLAPDVRLLVLTAPLMLNFTSFINYSYFMYPDYPLWMQPIMLALVLHSVRLYSDPPRMVTVPFRPYLAPALLAGLALALKPTYFLFPLLVVGLHVLAFSARPWLNLARFAAVAGTLFGVSLVAFFGGRWHHIAAYFAALRAFANSSRAAYNAAFVRDLLRPFASWSYNTLSIFWWQLVVVALMMVLAMYQSQRRNGRVRLRVTVLVAAGVACIGLHVWAMMRRGGGTSFNDTVMVMWPFVILLLGVMPPDRSKCYTYSVVVSIGFLLPTAWIAAHAHAFVTNDGIIPNEAESERRAHGRWNQRLYDWNRSHGLPVVVLAKDPALLTGSVEDMVMRGMVDALVGTWDDAETSAAKKYFSHLHFVGFESRYGAREGAERERRFAFPRDYVFVWAERIRGEPVPYHRDPRRLSRNPDRSAEPREFDRLVARWVAEEGYRDLVGRGQCRSWDNVHWQRRVFSCVVHRP